MATVSIIIPCYNAGVFIDEAIQSALRQTHKDLEIIVIDDGSTDSQTRRVLEKGEWARTRILRQNNKGPAAARNAGIQAANGEFILPLDADDRIDPTYVEKALAVMRLQPQIGIVYCKAMRFGVEEGPWDLPPYSLRAMVIDNIIFCTALYRKSDWKSVGGYSETMRHGVEDYEFWIKMLSKGVEVHQIDEYLFYYRVQKSSRTAEFLKDKQAVIATYAEIFRNNKDFFARHADVIYQHRFGLYQEIVTLRKPLEKVEKILNRMPWIRKLARSFYRRVVR